MVIAIDGPGGVGKSTVSRAVAKAVDAAYLDTGSTYRAATLAVLEADIALDDEEAILAEIEQRTIDYDTSGILLDGTSVATDVRSDRVTNSVSEVSAHPSVRAAIVDVQRAWVRNHGGHAVVEGRDIGTVVFPDAPVKVFLTARPEVRAARRAGDAEAATQSVEEIARSLEARDTADASREASPMKPADDAVVIDTSDMSIDQVIAQIVDLIADRESGAIGPL